MNDQDYYYIEKYWIIKDEYKGLWKLMRFVIEIFLIKIFVIKKLEKEEYWYSWIIIILESIGSLKMNIKDCENLWDLWMIEIFLIEKLDKGEYWYLWMIKIIIILESIGSSKI